MTMGSMSWACLLLALNAALPPDVVPMNKRSFDIPIKFDPVRQAEIQELILYVSRDEGQSWQMYAKATPDKENFNFTADRDGSYWFTVQVMTKKGIAEPANPAQGPVGVKTLIDTLKPEVHLLADRRGDEVALTWDVIEANLDPATLKLEYHAADMPTEQWLPVPGVVPGQSRVSFKAPASALMIRLQIQDVAGNVGHADAQVSAAAGTRPVSETTVTPDGPKSLPPPSPVVDPRTSPGGEPRAVPHSPTNPEDEGQQPLARGDQVPSPGGMPLSSGAPSTMPGMGGPLPPVQIINKRQVKLDFDVGKFGPSGVGSVDVWVTLDNGQTWEKSEIDRNAILPGTSDVRPGQPIHGSVMVQLNKPEPTVYGFYLVVKSRANLGKPPPRSGDMPQVRVEVDTTLPQAELYNPKPDPNQPQALVLTWKASDRNLTANPISLEWAEHKEGPWTFVQSSELPNTGRLTWPIPTSMPYQVYLRLTVRDKAGNSAVAETRDPVTIDMTVPELEHVSISAAVPSSTPQ